jgi:hypothetical protein
MRKFLVPLLAGVLLLTISAAPASAAWGGRGGWGGHEVHRGGCVGCGFVGGLVLGGVVGGLLGGALAAPAYAAPLPVYAPAPPPPRACYTQPGYWSQVPTVGPGGYALYQNVWVPAQTICQ